MDNSLFYQEPNSQVYCGHALDVLANLPDESVDCVPTSPPYWGLRSYKTEPIIWDNHQGCEHKWGRELIKAQAHRAGETNPGKEGYTKDAGGWSDRQGAFCLKCGAWRGELGQEPTIELYISHLLQIFDEVKRVLKKTGTLWVNIGDSYYGGGFGHSNQSAEEFKALYPKQASVFCYDKETRAAVGSVKQKGLLPAKTLCLIPERFALGMVERGWILRNNIIWYKSNPMPESVKDRFTGSYEYLYFFVKSQRYWFEQQFDPYTEPLNRWGGDFTKSTDTTDDIEGIFAIQEREGRARRPNELGRNKRDVWEINTEPSPAHLGIRNFATFPPALIETPILAGCPPMICKKCGKAREKIYEKTGHVNQREDAHCFNNTPTKVDSTGWGPTEIPTDNYTDCGCNAGFEPGVVLDPFAGSGTAGAVAKKLGRKYIGIELSPDYCKLHVKRLQEIPLPMELALA